MLIFSYIFIVYYMFDINASCTLCAVTCLRSSLDLTHAERKYCAMFDVYACYTSCIIAIFKMTLE